MHGNDVKQFGFSLLENPDEATEPFDVAFHTSGTGAGLQAALDLVGLEGRVIEMSWYGDQAVNVHLGGDFHILRKQLISSQVSRIPVAMQARWDHRRRMRAVFKMLRDPAFDMHLTHEITLEEAAELFNDWRSSPPEGIGYCIRYS
jgi:threonine dehydrogenase-like Zn-dependent dehydrogenase